MKRWHLVELEDLNWFPSLLRNYMTDYLRTIVERFDIFASAIPVLSDTLSRTRNTSVVDLASGGGGSWQTLIPKLQTHVPDLQVTLTDLYPNSRSWTHLAAQFPGVIQTHDQPVDARNVPAHLVGLRTQFLSLHHFSPEDAIAILASAVQDKAPIAIFEAQKRDLKHAIQFALAPIMVLLITPWIRPFEWTRLLFTYLVPLVPIFVGWDGVISVLRTYTIAEMLDLAKSADPNALFTWESREIASGQITVCYLSGRPNAVLGKESVRTPWPHQ